MYFLTQINAKNMQAVISATVILLVVLLWRGLQFGKNAGRLASSSVGMISGLLNGGATIGGPPVVLFYYSLKDDIPQSRASLIAFFLATDLFAAGICATQGLVTVKSLTHTAILLIPLVI